MLYCVMCDSPLTGSVAMTKAGDVAPAAVAYLTILVARPCVEVLAN